MELRADGCILRPWQRGDEADLVRHANSREIWRNLTDRFPHPYTREEAVAWIGVVESQGKPPQSFAIVVADEAVGGVGVELGEGEHRRMAGIGYWIGEAHWGKGLATAALRRLTAYAFETFDLERLEAHVFAWNPASCRVLEKAGYTLEGRLRQAVFKDGRLTDELVYARLRSD